MTCEQQDSWLQPLRRAYKAHTEPQRHAEEGSKRWRKLRARRAQNGIVDTSAAGCRARDTRNREVRSIGERAGGAVATMWHVKRRASSLQEADAKNPAWLKAVEDPATDEQRRRASSGPRKVEAAR